MYFARKSRRIISIATCTVLAVVGISASGVNVSDRSLSICENNPKAFFGSVVTPVFYFEEFSAGALGQLGLRKPESCRQSLRQINAYLLLFGRRNISDQIIKFIYISMELLSILFILALKLIYWIQSIDGKKREFLFSHTRINN